jgi:membrane protease YdiL (CAAX protease family)
MGKNWDDDSGLVVINEADSPALEWIRFWNLFEPFVVYALFLGTVWSSHLDRSFTWIYIAFGAQLTYLTFISPILHYCVEKKYYLRPNQQSIWFYFFDGRGLGSPRQFFRSIGERPAGFKKYWKEVVVTLGGVCLLCIGTLLGFQGYLSRMFGMTKEQVWEVSAWGLPLLLLLAFVLLPVIIRWDNYKRGMFSFLKVSGLGVLLIVAGHFFFQVFPTPPFLMTDTPVKQNWSRFSMVILTGKSAVYLFWGLVQQFFFLSIFNTNFARAFDIREKKGIFSAAVCSALFFGLIHLPNIWLFAATLILGFLWSFYFMKTRNLFVMALSYCLLASLADWLLPLSLSSGLTSYSGSVPLYFVVKGGVFLILPLCLGLFSFLQGNALKYVKVGSSILFALFILWGYPDAGQGPHFYWGKNGNGRTWQSGSQMALTTEANGFTEYLTTGANGFIVSQPLYITSDKAESLLLDMAVDPFSAHDKGAVYFDTGNGFNKKERRMFPLKKGRVVYHIPLTLAKNLMRLRLDPSQNKGRTVRLYALKIGTK